MKKVMLGPAVLFVFLLAAILTSFAFSSQAKSAAVTEEARTLQMIASYRSWGKANKQPIAVPVDQAAAGG
jgi:hypothetical protein